VKKKLNKKIINRKIINKFPEVIKIIKNNNEELPVKDWVQKYRSIVPGKYIIELLLRSKFLSDKELRLFAVWCARESLKLVKNPDIRSIEACNVSEKYANGQATKKELKMVYKNAYDAFDEAYESNYDTSIDTHDANHIASIAHFSAFSSVFASDSNVITASIHAAFAARIAAYDDADTMVSAQLDYLLTYF
jgi:hypothetical protein